jgi:hypothetical protein
MMSKYERNLRERIANILTEQLNWIDVNLRADTVAWLAQSVYDELEDELRGPA